MRKTRVPTLITRSSSLTSAARPSKSLRMGNAASRSAYGASDGSEDLGLPLQREPADAGHVEQWRERLRAASCVWTLWVLPGAPDHATPTFNADPALRLMPAVASRSRCASACTWGRARIPSSSSCRAAWQRHQRDVARRRRQRIVVGIRRGDTRRSRWPICGSALARRRSRARRDRRPPARKRRFCSVSPSPCSAVRQHRTAGGIVAAPERTRNMGAEEAAVQARFEAPFVPGPAVARSRPAEVARAPGSSAVAETRARRAARCGMRRWLRRHRPMPAVRGRDCSTRRRVRASTRAPAGIPRWPRLSRCEAANASPRLLWNSGSSGASATARSSNGNASAKTVALIQDDAEIVERGRYVRALSQARRGRDARRRRGRFLGGRRIHAGRGHPGERLGRRSMGGGRERAVALLVAQSAAAGRGSLRPRACADAGGMDRLETVQSGRVASPTCSYSTGSRRPQSPCPSRTSPHLLGSPRTGC